MDIALSVWKPWWNALPPNGRSLAEQVNLAHKVRANAVAIKGVQNSGLYGAEENMIWPGKQYSNDAMEAEIKRQGLDLGIWGWTDLSDPHGQAAAWQKAVVRWQPKWVKVDGEGSTFKANAHHTGTFLRSLGRLKRHDGTPVPVYLQSYYRPGYHPEVAWVKWFSYTDESGAYLLDGIAPQAYPIQSHDFVGKYHRMLSEYMVLLAKADREDIKWHVTLPVFQEWGWRPTADDLIEGIAFLQSQLGDNLLVGLDYWRLWFLFSDSFAEILEALGDLAFDPPDEPDEPDEPGVPDPRPVEARRIRDNAFALQETAADLASIADKLDSQ